MGVCGKWPLEVRVWVPVVEPSFTCAVAAGVVENVL